MGREEGGGFKMGNTCIPVVDHFNIWQNQYNIVKLKKKKKTQAVSLDFLPTGISFSCPWPNSTFLVLLYQINFICKLLMN